MTAQPDANRPSTATRARFERCFSSLGCQTATFEEVIELAGRHKISCIELRSLEGRTDLPALMASLPGGWEGARRRLESSGLSVRVLGTSFKLAGHQSDHWRELLEFASLADALGAPFLRVFGGGTWGTPLTLDEEAQAVQAVRRWETERMARGLRAQILIETHDAFSASTPCLRLIEGLGNSVGILWDSHHTWRLGNESPAATWQALAPFIRHVHIKDSVDRPSARHPYTYVLSGTGQMPGLEVRKALELGGYTGAVSLEWEKMWHPYLTDLSEALAATDANGWW